MIYKMYSNLSAPFPHVEGMEDITVTIYFRYIQGSYEVNYV